MQTFAGAAAFASVCEADERMGSSMSEICCLVRVRPSRCAALAAFSTALAACCRLSFSSATSLARSNCSTHPVNLKQRFGQQVSLWRTWRSFFDQHYLLQNR